MRRSRLLTRTKHRDGNRIATQIERVVFNFFLIRVYFFGKRIMNRINSIKSICLLFCGLLACSVVFPLQSAEAQCLRCRRLPNLPPLTVPMWEVYGVNPYYPRPVYSVTFTPLQRQVIGYGQPACITCDVATPALPLNGSGEFVPQNDSASGGLPEENAPPSGEEQVDGSLSSPSDIIQEPTPKATVKSTPPPKPDEGQ